MGLVGESKEIGIDYDDFYNRLVNIEDPIVVEALYVFVKALEANKNKGDQE